MDELHEINNGNNNYLAGLSETYILSQFKDRELEMLRMSLFHNDGKTGIRMHESLYLRSC